MNKSESLGTIIVAMSLMFVIIMMILPIPVIILDFGLAISFGLAILIFTVTLFVDRPLDFSSFPTILLVSLVLRLSLNVSSTKLIIGEGHTGTSAAGSVIEGFAHFIMSGNVFLGLVVFSILLIVNFAVITKGAARMAEVGARFALDAMPGKQLAIDADVAAGAITSEEANRRRTEEQQETTFFGSLDGASKFVKGDAVAGLLIVLLNLLVGLAMGTLVHGMSFSTAFETYTILTVGDGLVSQIPAVIVSIASGLLLARGRSSSSLSTTLFQQLAGNSTLVVTVSLLMVFFAFIPGLPFFPFMLAGAILLLFAVRRSAPLEQADQDVKEVPISQEKSLGDILEIEEVHLKFSRSLIDLVLDQGTGLDVRIRNMRHHVATAYGVVLPEIRLTDDLSLPDNSYEILIHGVSASKGKLFSDMVLVIKSDETSKLPAGKDVLEPVYGAPARWVSNSERERIAVTGQTVVAPMEVLATHLLEVVKESLPRLLTHKSLQRLLNEFVNLSDPERNQANRKLLDEMLPEKVQTDTLLQVLKLLLSEKVSIRNLPLILETIAEYRDQQFSIELICECVRQKLGFQILASLQRPDDTVPIIQISPEWEKVFVANQMDTNVSGLDVALPPPLFQEFGERLADAAGAASANGVFPAFVTTARRRRFVSTIAIAKGIRNPVVSFEELGPKVQPTLVGSVGYG